MLIAFDPAIPYMTDGYTNPLEGWAGVRFVYSDMSTLTEAATMSNVNCFPSETILNGLPYISFLPLAP